MANMAYVKATLRGKKANVKSFINVLEQNGDIWMGRGMEVYEYYDNTVNSRWTPYPNGMADVPGAEDDVICIAIVGATKWSILASLHLDAQSMESQRTTGEGEWAWRYGIENVKKFVTLAEACRMFNVDADFYSSEEGCNFDEHYRIMDGKVVEEEGASYGGFQHRMSYLPKHAPKDLSQAPDEIGSPFDVRKGKPQIEPAADSGSETK